MLYAKGLIVQVKENGAPFESEIFTFRFTTEVIDRMEEIVEMDGWEFANFMLNAVFLAVHDYRKFPIGKVLSVYRMPDGYYCDVVFDLKDPLGEQAAHKYRNGFLNAVSVGFNSLEMVMPTRAGEKLRHKRKELLEISAVPVPANPEALMKRGVDGEMLEGITDNGLHVDIRAGDPVDLVHGEPLKLTPEQRAALPPLPPLDGSEDLVVVVSLSKAEHDALLKFGDGPAAWIAKVQTLERCLFQMQNAAMALAEKKLGKGKRAELADVADKMDREYKALAGACDDLIEKQQTRIKKMLDDMMDPEEPEEEPKPKAFDAETFAREVREALSKLK